MTNAQILSQSLNQRSWPVHTEEHPSPIERYGCYAWVLAMAAQLWCGEVFSMPGFERVCKIAEETPRFDGLPSLRFSDMELNDPEKFTQCCFDALAPGRWRVWQRGTSEAFFDGSWYKGPATMDYSFIAQRWRRPPFDEPDVKKRKYHWTLLMPYEQIAWDPHGSLRPLFPVDGLSVMYLVQES